VRRAGPGGRGFVDGMAALLKQHRDRHTHVGSDSLVVQQRQAMMETLGVRGTVRHPAVTALIIKVSVRRR
jgi:hypothetical protein